MAGNEARKGVPFAARQQSEIGHADLALTFKAQELHRLAKWWWGQRQADTGREAVCYVCGQVLAKWDGKWPMTAAAKHRVMEHRALHVYELETEREGTEHDEGA